MHFVCYFKYYLCFINDLEDNSYNSNTSSNCIDFKENNIAISKIKVVINLLSLAIKMAILIKRILVKVIAITKTHIKIACLFHFVINLLSLIQFLAFNHLHLHFH